MPGSQAILFLSRPPGLTFTAADTDRTIDSVSST